MRVFGQMTAESQALENRPLPTRCHSVSRSDGVSRNQLERRGSLATE
jgi:hypothetical protein